MTKQSEEQNVERFADRTTSQESAAQAMEPGKKAFVEPEISVPIDVTETTTFFQSATSGATN